MAIVNCKECGKAISSNAKKCPNCGAPVKKKSGCFIIVLIAIMFIIIFFYIVGQISGGNFEDIGYHKKETLNGSYYRVYSVYVNDFKDTPEKWDNILKYAKNKMYTDRANRK